MGGQAQGFNRADIKSAQKNKNTCGMSHERCVMSHSMQAPTGCRSGYVRYAATRVNMGLRAADATECRASSMRVLQHTLTTPKKS